MLALHRQAAFGMTCFACNAAVPMAATDAQIDRLVYALYDLTDEEIAIVEGATPHP